MKKKINTFYQKLHQKAPSLGKAASFATAASVISANTFTYGLPLWLLGATKVVTGSAVADKKVIKIAKHWINVNNKLIDSVLPERDWRIEMPDDLEEDKQYLLISNHLSWVDTSIVQYISEGRLPLTRFFTKFNLIYIPFVGQAFYFLDFPMMKRHTKAQIAKNPALKDRDILEAKRACELLKDKPFALLNYLEGTRFTPAKRDAQKSPFKNLLKPKAGGISLAIQALGPQIDGILDMTIVYPDGSPSYSDLWKGNIKRLGVNLQRIDIPQELFTAIEEGDYNNDENMKQTMYAWLDKVWRDKDELITRMHADFADSPKSFKS
ncbi:acyltransferase [Psychrobacter sp. FDAARGOS_221]|uniref:acyltransferase n=1 Tax=Psychrobacter sp. FDAARGOS_221 TaxID=1975705 RepID=UPI000BB54C73|nr:acyltransferase [Psychrobacter sp. FDAARGOS_221]PNK61004.1 acyltransferase [Psychrobacter sp. FDAARGOS_221]